MLDRGLGFGFLKICGAGGGGSHKVGTNSKEITKNKNAAGELYQHHWLLVNLTNAKISTAMIRMSFGVGLPLKTCGRKPAFLPMVIKLPCLSAGTLA